MDALLSFRGQSDTPDSPESGITHLGAAVARRGAGEGDVRAGRRADSHRDTPGTLLGPWRKMSIDGLEWDIPHAEANAAAFGYPGSGKDGSPAAYPRPGR